MTLNSLKEDIFQVAFSLLLNQICRAQLVHMRALNYFGCIVTILITYFKVFHLMRSSFEWFISTHKTATIILCNYSKMHSN